MGSSQNQVDSARGGLSVKDLVLIGVLGAVAFIICLVISMLCGLSPVTNAFYPIIVAIPNGIVYMLMLAKVPKRGVFTISSIVYGLLLLLVGCFWFIPLCMVVAGVIADFAILGKHPRDGRRMIAGYALTVVGQSFGYSGSIVLLRDTFNEVMIKNGIPDAYRESLNAIISDPMLAVMVVLALAAAVLGGLLGRKVLKKHFVRSGLVNA